MSTDGQLQLPLRYTTRLLQVEVQMYYATLHYTRLITFNYTTLNQLD